ncbi:MAG: hypothetical protein ACI901_001850 [Octadecabacter sp.]|jgi:hypothetical protein
MSNCGIFVLRDIYQYVLDFPPASKGLRDQRVKAAINIDKLLLRPLRQSTYSKSTFQ